MAKDDLTSFKIGDMRSPSVRSTPLGKKGKPAAEAAPAESVGFPAIEAHLEHGTVDSVAESLRASYEALEALSQGKDMRKRAAAGRAMIAYERAADLFEYLFQTKDALSGPSE